MEGACIIGKHFFVPGGVEYNRKQGGIKEIYVPAKVDIG